MSENEDVLNEHNTAETVDSSGDKTDLKESMKGIKNVFDKVEAKTKELKDKDEQDSPKKKKDALVTCRILFISILDKIMIIILSLAFIIQTYANFRGDLSSIGYGFWHRILGEIGIIIGTVISYFIMNWIYKCYAKTMLCVTDGEIYYEKYLPFYRWEGTIPLNKVTGIQSFKFFWIFRAVVIWQYMHLPKVFWTWNAQQFKDKVEELLTKNDFKVNNQFESRNILNKGQYKYVVIAGVVLVAIIAFVGVIRFFSYIFSDERNMQGTYTNGSQTFVLDKDGSCTIRLDNVKSLDCNWNYNPDIKEVVFQYTYEVRSYGSSSQLTGYLYVPYQKRTLTHNSVEFKK